MDMRASDRCERIQGLRALDVVGRDFQLAYWIGSFPTVWWRGWWRLMIAHSPYFTNSNATAARMRMHFSWL